MNKDAVKFCLLLENVLFLLGNYIGVKFLDVTLLKKKNNFQIFS